MNIEKTVVEQNTERQWRDRRYFLEIHTDLHGGDLSGLLEESWRHGDSRTELGSGDLEIFQPSLPVLLQHGEDTSDQLHCHLPTQDHHLLQPLDGSNHNLERD